MNTSTTRCRCWLFVISSQSTLGPNGPDEALGHRVGVSRQLHCRRAVRRKPFELLIPSIRCVAGPSCPSPQSEPAAGGCSVPRRNDRIDSVLEMILVIVRALALACRGHHELVLENLALRQQLNR